MAVSSMSLSLSSAATISIGISQFDVPCSSKSSSLRPTWSSNHGIITCSKDTLPHEETDSKRRAVVFGAGAAAAFNMFSATSPWAQGIPDKFEAFVDKRDGYSYYYPSDWRDFEFVGHDSAFKDRYLQMQNVRLSFIPTNKSDIHDLGPLEEVVFHLVNHVYSAPTQVADVMDMREKNIDGRNYYTFEYVLTNRNFSRAAFATIAIGNGRYYTLIVGANERRWKRLRNQLKVVADSFRVMDI